jgi:hypothetical protein
MVQRFSRIEFCKCANNFLMQLNSFTQQQKQINEEAFWD